MTRTTRRRTSDWTRAAAGRARDVNSGVRGRIHQAGDALLGRRARRHWLTTLAIFVMGGMTGAAVAVSGLRRTPPPLGPGFAENEGGETGSDSTAPRETVGANRSR